MSGDLSVPLRYWKIEAGWDIPEEPLRYCASGAGRGVELLVELVREGGDELVKEDIGAIYVDGRLLLW